MPIRRPNILLLFSDQHNANALGCAGNDEIITPNLDALANQGAIFSRTYCQNGMCMPSRTSLFTGQYCSKTKIYINDDKMSINHLIPINKILKNSGYTNAIFGKAHLHPSHYQYWDMIFARNSYIRWIKKRGQFEKYMRDWLAVFKPMACHISELKPYDTITSYIATKTIDFIKQRIAPFFCCAFFMHPHQPYTPIQEYVNLYDPQTINLPVSINEPIKNLPTKLQELRNRNDNPWCLKIASDNLDLYRMYISYYYALVTEIDYHIGQIINTLKEEKIIENTIIIYTSDHGDFLGNHGMIEKCAHGHNVYEDILRIPLIIRCPNQTKNIKCDDLIELVDLYPTILDAADIKYDKQKLPGSSLMPVIKNRKLISREYAISIIGKREYALSESADQITIIGKRYKLGHWKKRKQRDMLFDLEEDPHELNNLIDSVKTDNIKTKMYQIIKIKSGNCYGCAS